MENYKSIETQRAERIRKRVKSVGGFYRHFMIYLCVNAVLLALKAVNIGKGEHFFEFSTFATAIFWGIGVVFHGFGVFTETVFFGRNWEEKKIRQLLEKEKRQRWE